MIYFTIFDNCPNKSLLGVSMGTHLSSRTAGILNKIPRIDCKTWIDGSARLSVRLW